MAPSSCEGWLLPEREEPAYKLAAKVLQGTPSDVPIDVLAIAQQRADVQFKAWSHDCDALVYGLTASRPGIIVKSLGQNYSRRTRMTIGHELGHIVIPWHLGTISGDGVNAIVETVQENSLSPLYRAQESEATAFASALLMPYASLVSDARDCSLQDFFRGLDRYEVSAQAAIIRIKQLLRPGFVFQGRYTDQLAEDASPGTQRIMANNDRSQQLAGAAFDSGEFTIGGKQVCWYLLASDFEFVSVSDPRSTTQLLRAAIAADSSVPPDAQEQTLRVINGVTSGALSNVRFRNETEALSHVRQWTGHSERIPSNVKVAYEFDLYLRRKVEERLAKLRESSTLHELAPATASA